MLFHIDCYLKREEDGGFLGVELNEDPRVDRGEVGGSEGNSRR